MAKILIEGKAITDIDVLMFDPMDQPAVAPEGKMRFYLDRTDGKLKMSVSGSAYRTVLDFDGDFKIKAGQKLILDGN